MLSTNPDYYWNPDANPTMPKYAAPSSYAFGYGGTAQMDSGSTQRRVISSDFSEYSRADPFSSERELVPTLDNGPSPDQWQQFPKAERYPTIGHAY